MDEFGVSDKALYDLVLSIYENWQIFSRNLRLAQ
jgi:hypothetical protein